MSELKNLYETVLDRKEHPEEGSYTAYLYEKGLNKILKKIGEETTEVVVASLSESKEDLIGELNDLICVDGRKGNYSGGTGRGHGAKGEETA